MEQAKGRSVPRKFTCITSSGPEKDLLDTNLSFCILHMPTSAVCLVLERKLLIAVNLKQLIAVNL